MINARRKGHDFERKVAARLRQKWPDLTVRRSQQAHQAFEPDVVVEGEGAPPIWVECHHGKTDPRKKYEQAVRDVDKAGNGADPVVVFCPPRSRRWFVMLRINEYRRTMIGVFDFEEWLATL